SPRARGEGAAQRRMRGAILPNPAEWRPSPGFRLAVLGVSHPLPASGARDLFRRYFGHAASRKASRSRVAFRMARDDNLAPQTETAMTAIETDVAVRQPRAGENPLKPKRVHHIEFLSGNAKQSAFFYRKAFG